MAVARVMDFRGTYKGGGGPDKTILNSAALHDPHRVHLVVVYLRQPDDDAFQIPAMARKAGVKHYVDVEDRTLIDRDCLKRLERIIVQNDLDILHAHDDKTLLYAWLLRLRLPHLKIMYTCHSHAVYSRGDFPCLREFLAFKARQKVEIFLMQRYLKPILAVSGDTRRRLLAGGLANDDVAVLHNGIDTEVWSRSGAAPVLREELGMAPGSFLVGTVARITYDKDLPTFYRVAEIVAERIENVTFVVVGDGYGDELARAQEEVARRGLEPIVRFTGHRADLRDVYASFDLFLMTSLTEGLPNTLLEAMAMGLPSVSTAVGGVPEALEDGTEGFLSPVGDAAGLAERVVRLLEHDELREKVGRCARSRIERSFSFSERVRRLEDYYHHFDCGGKGAVPAFS